MGVKWGGCEGLFKINTCTFKIITCIFFSSVIPGWELAGVLFFFFCTNLESAPRTKENRAGENDSYKPIRIIYFRLTGQTYFGRMSQHSVRGMFGLDFIRSYVNFSD